MNKRRQSLSEQLNASKPKEKPASKPAKKTGRAGKRSVCAHFEPAVVRQLKTLAAKEDKTSQALMGEALNLLFQHYGLDPIAEE